VPAAWLRASVTLPLAAAVVVAALGFWHLDRVPGTWFDEGSYLLVAQSLAEGGPYAAPGADGTLDYAPIIGVGPTLLGPVALLMALAGDNLQVARSVPVVFMALTTALFAGVAQGLFGRRAALLSLLILLTMPALDWLETGRQVLGEMLAFGLLLAGGMLAVRSRSLRGALLGGVLLGLTMVTKGQYLLVLPPVIGAVALIDHFDERLRPLRWYVAIGVAACATYAVWMFTLLATLGDGQIVENIRLLRDASGGALVVFSPARMAAALTLLLGPGSYFLVLPSILFGAWAVKHAHGTRRLGLLSLWVFQVAWLGWFAFASIGWPRYAFPGLAVSALFMGLLISVAITAAGNLSGDWWPRAHNAGRVLSWAVLGVIVALCLAGAARTVGPMLRNDERGPQTFAALLDATVPPDAAVAGWEPEIDYLSEHRLHYPPAGSLDRAVRATWLQQGATPDFSDQLHADYLVVGPFGRWVGAYALAIESGVFEPLAEAGGYTLYRRAE
jgi:4-amino-4-deoxy-L-arabinose transferase-like glycosyltransferase